MPNLIEDVSHLEFPNDDLSGITFTNTKYRINGLHVRHVVLTDSVYFILFDNALQVSAGHLEMHFEENDCFHKYLRISAAFIKISYRGKKAYEKLLGIITKLYSYPLMSDDMLSYNGSSNVWWKLYTKYPRKVFIYNSKDKVLVIGKEVSYLDAFGVDKHKSIGLQRQVIAPILEESYNYEDEEEEFEVDDAETILFDTPEMISLDPKLNIFIKKSGKQITD